MLKEQSMQRGEGACEFCGLELGEESHLHHRWYPKRGPDTLRNLMLVHPLCHKAIHFGDSIPALRGSLAAQGDAGKGNGQRWRHYLSS